MRRSPRVQGASSCGLFSECGSNGTELTRAAEFLVFVRDKLCVLILECFSRRSEIEFGRLVPKEFAVNARPDEAAIGVDIHFGNAKARGWQVFLLVHAA